MPFRLTRPVRVWAALVYVPFALLTSWGLSFEASVRSITIFRVMGYFAPLELWGLFWLVIGVAAIVAAATGWARAYAWATVGASALTVGQLVATFWARAVVGSALTTVGIAWAYLPTAVFALILVGTSRDPDLWLERKDEQ